MILCVVGSFEGKVSVTSFRDRTKVRNESKDDRREREREREIECVCSDQFIFL